MMPLPPHERLETGLLMRKDDPKSPAAASKRSMSICFTNLAEILELMETFEDSMNSVLNGRGKIAGTLMCCAASPAIH